MIQIGDAYLSDMITSIGQIFVIKDIQELENDIVTIERYGISYKTGKWSLLSVDRIETKYLGKKVPDELKDELYD